MKDLPLILPARGNNGDRLAWHLFVIRLNEKAKITRDEVINRMSYMGIGTSVHYVPLHRQPYWQDRYQLSSTMFPVADKAYQTMLSIPLYTLMTDDDQSRVIDALHEILL